MSFAGPASASVVEHELTPASDPGLPGVDVTVVRRADGSLVFTLSVQPASLAVRPPRITSRPGASRDAAWVDPDANPLVARIVVPRAQLDTTVITLMRDFGVVGHHYILPTRAWR